MFDILIAGDAYVPDHDAAVRQAAAELGTRPLDPKRFVKTPDQRIVWSYNRIHPDLRVAPTVLEFLATMPDADGWVADEHYDFVPEIAAAQGKRPARLHSTSVGVRDIDVLADRLASLGVTHRVAEPSQRYPFRRLWVGNHPDRPYVHDPAADGGTHLEFLPTAVLRLPDPGPVDPPVVDEGVAVRITARTLLVADLSDTLQRYEKHFDWAPVSAPSRGADGVLRARFRPDYPRGAELELIEAGPSAQGYEADFVRTHGPGACSIRVAVRDVAAAHERLGGLGVSCVRGAELDGVGERLIRPAEFKLGTAFELVEWDGS
jgi:hypothetical protein